MVTSDDVDGDDIAGSTRARTRRGHKREVKELKEGKESKEGKEEKKGKEGKEIETIQNGLVVYVYLKQPSTSHKLTVGIDELRVVARAAKVYKLSRVVVITDIAIQSVTRNRIERESKLATRTDPMSLMEAQRFPSKEFAGVKWQFRLMEQFKCDLTDHELVQKMRLMTDDEIMDSTCSDGIPPLGWPKYPVDKTPICYYAFDVDDCIWIGTQACLVVAADESEDSPDGAPSGESGGGDGD
jgi:hypothetical protein